MSLFTVVIPTLDRAETLGHTLESCICQDDANFQILVSDNLSVDNTRELVAEYQLRDNRIKYVRPERRLGQSKHWEFALGQVKEGFTMILGADDALLPRCMARARQCLVAYPDVKVLASTPSVFYFYPNAGGSEAGKLNMQECGFISELRNSKDGLNAVIRGEKSITELPYPYACAWMHVDILDKVREQTGRLIPCRTPPVFLTIACMAYTDTYLHINPGFGCPGVSAKSIGYSAQHAHGDRGKDKDFFSESNIEDKDIGFHPKVGDSRSEHMHVAETLLMAQEVGVIPEEPAIAWNRLLAMAYRDFERGDWNEADKRENLDSLIAISRNVGCAEVIDLAGSTSNFKDWKSQLGLDLYERPIEGATVAVNTTPMNLKGVHEAAQLADMLLEAAVTGPRDGRVDAMNSSPENLLWWLLACLDENRKMREWFNNRTVESDRRAKERDRAKEQVAKLKRKIESLQQAAKREGGGFFSRISGSTKKHQ